MQALPLPPRHIWRVTFLAGLLTIAVMVALLLTAAPLGSSDGGPTADPVPAPAPTTTAAPAWVTDPLAPVTIAPR